MLAPLNDTGLGLMRGKDKSAARPVKTLAAQGLNTTSGLKDALILTKTNARSRVHRAGYMDYIGVLEFDAKGKIIGEQRFLGLFTSSAYNRRPWEIPLVRQRHEHVMKQSGLAPASHSGKALRHITETLPREELFQSSEDELFRTAMGVLGLQERVRSRLFLRRDKYSRFISALVYLPRERFNTDVRLRIEAMLKDALHGEFVDSSVVLGESPLAQVHLIVRPKPGEMLDVDTAELEQKLAQVLRNWQDDLREALVARHGETEGLRIAARIGKALPAGYIEDNSTAVAANDVSQLDALTGPDDLRLSLQAVPRESGDGLRLKLYRQLDDIPLSDALPMMENMGLRVIAERPYRLSVDNAPVYVQDFEVESTAGAIDAASVDEAFGETFARVWHGDAENDGFNRRCWRPACTGAGRHAAWLLQVPAADRRAVLAGLRGRHVRALPAAGPSAGRAVRSPLRSSHRPREQGRHRRRPGPAEGPLRCAGCWRRGHPEGAQDRGRRPQGRP